MQDRPIEKDVNDSMDDEEKASAKTGRRIVSYVTTQYPTSDGQDEAIGLKVETGGSAVPQLVYIFDWKDDKPAFISCRFEQATEPMGGLKDIRTENDEVVVELYGQDRFILGQTDGQVLR